MSQPQRVRCAERGGDDAATACKQSPVDFAKGTGMNQLADEQRADPCVIRPQSRIANMQTAEWFDRGRPKMRRAGETR